MGGGDHPDPLIFCCAIMSAEVSIKLKNKDLLVRDDQAGRDLDFDAALFGRDGAFTAALGKGRITLGR